MKKLLAIIMAICLMASVLCMPAFAADMPTNEPAAGTVMRVSALKTDGTTVVVIKDYDDFKIGWTEAMELAEDEDEMEDKSYDRIVVDLYADWKVKDGDYAHWIIDVPADARVTLNLNGHTINRDRTRAAEDGEALYVSDDTDLIINNGTITGGWSHGGAGAIHIKNDAKVTLNNVHIVGNISSYDGGGISLESGSILTVNGGSFKDNIADWAKTYNDDPAFYNCYGGAVYVEKATAIFNGVEFKNNSAPRGDSYGAAIYGDNANIVIDNCTFVENGIKMENIASADSVIHGADSKIKVTGSTFTNNGGDNPDYTEGDGYSAVFKLDESELTIDACEFRDNLSDFIIRDEDESVVSVSNTKFLNNSSAVMCGDSDTSANSFFDQCTFDTNGSHGLASFYDISTTLTFYNCSMGNSTFNNKKNIKFVSDVSEADRVLSVSALKTDGTTVKIMDYLSFETGWNDAITLASDFSKMKANAYDRVVVTLYADWNSKGDGVVTIPENVKMTLNMNGHTIDRDLSIVESDGEVIYVDEKADLIINDGTIKGGFSDNGAGGIHIKNKANVILKDVHVIDNAVKGDDGAAIAVYGGANLIMNGGSISNNFMKSSNAFSVTICPYGALYANESTVTLENVTLSDNYTFEGWAEGVAIYATKSTVTMDKCIVSGNAVASNEGRFNAESVIAGYDSKFIITDTDFTNNASDVDENCYEDSRLFYFEDSHLTIEGGKITQNNPQELFYFEDSNADITGVTITENQACVMNVNNDHEIVNLIECVLGNNTPNDNNAAVEIEKAGNLTMIDCVLGNTTFSNIQYVKITTSEVTREEAVIGIELLRKDGTVDSIRYYKDFASGWDYATECAKSGFFDRVVVTLYADWNTNKYGVVTVPANAKMTLNMNGHTIDRAQNNVIYDGEVMYISQNADVIINDGTIKNGFSTDGAGGIHIMDNATVVLNNVNIVDNGADGSNGAGIAVYDGAVLVMNGGSISNNEMSQTKHFHFPYGTLYVNDATATLNNVTVSNNRSNSERSEGMAICVDGGTVTLNNCVVSDNAKAIDGYKYAESVIATFGAKLIINNTDFTGNGSVSGTDDLDYSHLFYLEDSTLTMTGGKITGNAADKLFYFEDSKADIKGVTITDNASVVLDIENDSAKVTMTECTLGNNDPVKKEFDVIVDTKGTLVMNNCTLGDTTFEDKGMVEGVGSLLGQGSLTTIVAFIALAGSVAAIGICISSKQKKALLAVAGHNE